MLKRKVCTLFTEKVPFADIDFHIEDGGFLHSRRRNGVGKTTLLRTIMGLPTERMARCRFRAKPVEHVDARESCNGIAYIPQEGKYPTLYSEGKPTDGHASLALTSLDPFAEHIFELFPICQILFDRLGVIFRPGQGKQQLGYLVGFLGDEPQVLILDEPTEGISAKYSATD